MQFPSEERQTINIEPAARLLGIARGLAYKLARRNELPVPVIRIGRRMVLSRAALERVLAGKAE